MKKLDLGCGPNKKEGFIGIDKRSYPGVDYIHDLDTFPYPFSDNEFDWIEISHVLEHLKEPPNVLNEVYRISKNGAIVHIITPHYSSHLSYGDPEHKYHFGYYTFLTIEESKRFRIKKCQLYFTDLYKLTGVGLLANLFPKKWEKYLSFIFPALSIEVFLEVNKNGIQK